MALPKVSLWNKDEALKKLNEDEFHRWFVKNGAVNLSNERNFFLHVQVIKKYPPTNFLVREFSSEKETSSENIELELDVGFNANTKKAISKILPGTELIVKGFEIKGNDENIKTIWIDYNREMAEIWILTSDTGDNLDYQDNIHEKYEYTKLKDLFVQDKVYLFGIIKEVTLPKKISNLFKVRLFLTDESIRFLNGIEFTISSENKSDLDKLKQFDIIRFHRVTIEASIGNPEVLHGCGQVGVKGFHLLVFDDDESNDADNDLKPSFSTSKTYTFTEKDKENVAALRKWCDMFSSKKDTFIFSCLPLCRFTTPGEYQNLLVQVLAVGNVKDLSDPVVLRVWDGSKISLHSLNMLNDFQKEAQNVFAFDKRRNRIVDKLNLSVDVFVYDEHRETAAKFKVGDIIKLVNVHAFKGSLNVPSLVLHGSQYSNAGIKYNRGTCLASSENPLVKELISKLDQIFNDADDHSADDDDADSKEDDDPATEIGCSSNATLSNDNSNKSFERCEASSDAPDNSDGARSTSSFTARGIADGCSPPYKRFHGDGNVTNKLFEDSSDSIQSEIYSQDEMIVRRSTCAKEPFVKTNE